MREEMMEDAVPVPLCQICGLKERQYKCPRCATLTCSLACCKQHKIDMQCSGHREASTFKTLNDMNANDLRRDYHFLENVLSRKDGAKRTLSQSCGGSYEPGGKGKGGARKRRNNVSKRPRIDTGTFSSNEAIPQNLEMHKPSVQRLVKASWDRKCYLSVMPPGMSRREKNTSRYAPKADTILWRLQIVFVAHEGAAKTPSELLQGSLETTGEGELTSIRGLVGLCREAVDEKVTIKEILSPFIDQMGSRDGKNEAQRHALRYLRMRRSEVTCLVQKIPSSSSNPVFLDVDDSLTLQEALAEKSTLEFPVLFVGLAEDVLHLRRSIEEVPEETEAEGEVKDDGDDGDDEEEEEEEAEAKEEEEDREEEGIDAVMEALQEMEGKPIQDLQRIIEEQAS